VCVLRAQSKGETFVLDWKRRMPMAQVLLQSSDGRTKLGLERAVRRLFTAKSKNDVYINPYNLLNNFLTRVRIYESFTVKAIKATDEGPLTVIAASIAVDGPFPTEILEALFDKRITRLGRERDYNELLVALDPFSASKDLNLMKLRISDFSDDLVFKCDKFAVVVFQTLLPPMLANGSFQQVWDFCSKCIKMFENIDFVTVDSEFVKKWRVWKYIWCAVITVIDFNCDSGCVDFGFDGQVFLGFIVAIHITAIRRPNL
jgi:hypothetical protein